MTENDKQLKTQILRQKGASAKENIYNETPSSETSKPQG